MACVCLYSQWVEAQSNCIQEPNQIERLTHTHTHHSKQTFFFCGKGMNQVDGLTILATKTALTPQSSVPTFFTWKNAHRHPIWRVWQWQGEIKHCWWGNLERERLTAIFRTIYFDLHDKVRMVWVTLSEWVSRRMRETNTNQTVNEKCVTL